MRLRSVTTAALCLTLGAAQGCYSTKGGIMPSSSSTFTYVSETWSPKTIQVVDTRTDEVFFSLTLPVSKQLTFRFMTGGGDDPVVTPDRMLWEVWDAPHSSGKLTNQLTCPPASARRIQVVLRETPEYPPESEEYRLRVDDPDGRSDSWTPKGGELPRPDDRGGFRAE